MINVKCLGCNSETRKVMSNFWHSSLPVWVKSECYECESCYDRYMDSPQMDQFRLNTYDREIQFYSRDDNDSDTRARLTLAKRKRTDLAQAIQANEERTNDFALVSEILTE